MTVAGHAFFIADCFAEGFTQGNADIFDGMVIVDMQVAFALDVQVDQPMSGDLVEHVLKKRNTDIESGLTGTIQVDRGFNLGFQSIALD